MRNSSLKMKAIWISFSILFAAEGAFADCMLNGKSVPEGTRVGDLVCRDGKWVEQYSSMAAASLASPYSSRPGHRPKTQ